MRDGYSRNKTYGKAALVQLSRGNQHHQELQSQITGSLFAKVENQTSD